MRGFIATAIQKKKSSALYCVNKHPIPNIFIALPLRNIIVSYLMRIKRNLILCTCSCSLLLLWIGKKK